MKSGPVEHTTIAGAERPAGTDARILAEVSASVAKPGRLLMIVLIAGLSGASFGSQSLVDWTAARHDSPAMTEAHSALVGWHQLMERLGLTLPAELLREAVRALEAISFDDS